MFLRAFLVIVSGFIFIFSPGLPMNLISRYNPDYKRNLVYWGIGGWFIATFFSLFINNILNGIFYAGSDLSGFSAQPLDFGYIFISSLISSTLLGLLMRGILKNRIKIEAFFIRIFNSLRSKNKEVVEQDKSSDLLPDGLALGFGAGLIAQVFTGISMVGAGFQVLFGNTAGNDTVKGIVNNDFGMILFSLITPILFRIALLVVSAIQGVLTAKSLQGEKGRFWLGVLSTVIFTSLLLIIQIFMGEPNPGNMSIGKTSTTVSIVSGIYYLAAFILGYVWLIKELKIQMKQN